MRLRVTMDCRPPRMLRPGTRGCSPATEEPSGPSRCAVKLSWPPVRNSISASPAASSQPRDAERGRVARRRAAVGAPLRRLRLPPADHAGPWRHGPVSVRVLCDDRQRGVRAAGGGRHPLRGGARHAVLERLPPRRAATSRRGAADGRPRTAGAARPSARPAPRRGTRRRWTTPGSRSACATRSTLGTSSSPRSPQLLRACPSGRKGPRGSRHPPVPRLVQSRRPRGSPALGPQSSTPSAAGAGRSSSTTRWAARAAAAARLVDVARQPVPRRPGLGGHGPPGDPSAVVPARIRGPLSPARCLARPAPHWLGSGLSRPVRARPPAS